MQGKHSVLKPSVKLSSDTNANIWIAFKMHDNIRSYNINVEFDIILKYLLNKIIYDVAAPFLKPLF